MEDLTSLDEIKKLRVVDLKERLSKLGLPTSGLKADLIDRLYQCTSQQFGSAQSSESSDDVDNSQMINVDPGLGGPSDDPIAGGYYYDHSQQQGVPSQAVPMLSPHDQIINVPQSVGGYGDQQMHQIYGNEQQYQLQQQHQQEIIHQQQLASHEDQRNREMLEQRLIEEQQRENQRLHMERQQQLALEEQQRLQLEAQQSMELQLATDEHQRVLMEEQRRLQQQMQLEEQQCVAAEQSMYQAEQLRHQMEQEQLRIQREEEQQRIIIQRQEEQLRIQREEELRIQREEQVRIQREEQLRIQREEELRMQREEEMRIQREEELRIQREEELRFQREQEFRIERENQLRMQREEELRIQREEELRFQQEELIIQRQEELRIQREEEMRIQREEEMRIQREEEMRIQREEEMRIQREEEMRIQREEELRIRRDEEVRIRREEELRIQREEELRTRREEEQRIQQEEELRIHREEQLRIQLEEEMQLQREEESRIQREEVLRIQREEQLRLQREEDLRVQREEELRIQRIEELRLQREEELRVQRDERRRFQEEEELRIQREAEGLQLAADEAARQQDILRQEELEKEKQALSNIEQVEEARIREEKEQERIRQAKVESQFLLKEMDVTPLAVENSVDDDALLQENLAAEAYAQEEEEEARKRAFWVEQTRLAEEQRQEVEEAIEDDGSNMETEPHQEGSEPEPQTLNEIPTVVSIEVQEPAQKQAEAESKEAKEADIEKKKQDERYNRLIEEAKNLPLTNIAVLNGDSGKSDAKTKLTKNQRRKLQKKRRQKNRELVRAVQQNILDLGSGDEEETDVEIEYVDEKLDLPPTNPSFRQFTKIFEAFKLGGTDHALAEAERAQAELKAQQDKENLLRKKPKDAEDLLEDDLKDKADAPPKLSKRKLKKLSRLSVAELKQHVSRPDVVEMHDVTARDPKLLVYLKAYRNTVPVPRHWCFKRKYLQGKRGIEKPPFHLPDFIARTGIMEMRQALAEKEDQKTLKSKMREKVRPKMGKIDIDYQKLHDAFFKWQTRPKMTIHGDLYYEGKEFETRMKDKKPGDLSDELRTALGMPVGPNAYRVPPPWLIAMQRYGPPPSYPNLKIPGLNAAIPETCSFGYHAGGWGKPPVDEFGRPLYGNVFGTTGGESAPSGTGAGLDEEIDRSLWGELESGSEEEEEEESEDEEEEDKEVDKSGLVTPGDAGLATPMSGISSVPTGLETPEMIELRKKKIESEMEGGDTPALFTVLAEKRQERVGASMMGSTHTYDLATAKARAAESGVSGTTSSIELALNPDELDLDSAAMAVRYEQTMREQTGLQKEDLSDMVAEHAAKQKSKRKRQQMQDTSGGTSAKTAKKYKDFKF